MIELKNKLSLWESFIKNFIDSKKKLKKQGILCTQRPFQVDFAEWYVSEFLKLKLTPTTVQKGYDAIDEKTGKTYQIKERMCKTLNTSTSFDFKFKKNKIEKFDFFIGVFFDKDYKLLAIIRVKYYDILKMGRENKKQNRFCFRWNKDTRNNSE